jgi:hypothetical protein
LSKIDAEIRGCIHLLGVKTWSCFVHFLEVKIGSIFVHFLMLKTKSSFVHFLWVEARLRFYYTYLFTVIYFQFLLPGQYLPRIFPGRLKIRLSYLPCKNFHNFFISLANSFSKFHGVNTMEHLNRSLVTKMFGKGKKWDVCGEGS